MLRRLTGQKPHLSTTLSGWKSRLEGKAASEKRLYPMDWLIQIAQHCERFTDLPMLVQPVRDPHFPQVQIVW